VNVSGRVLASETEVTVLLDRHLYMRPQPAAVDSNATNAHVVADPISEGQSSTQQSRTPADAASKAARELCFCRYCGSVHLPLAEFAARQSACEANRSVSTSVPPLASVNDLASVAPAPAIAAATATAEQLAPSVANIASAVLSLHSQAAGIEPGASVALAQAAVSFMRWMAKSALSIYKAEKQLERPEESKLKLLVPSHVAAAAAAAPICDFLRPASSSHP